MPPRRHQASQTLSSRELSEAAMRLRYDYDAMILYGPLPDYAYIQPLSPDAYVQCWKHAFTPRSQHHFSIAPDSNNDGFHITSANNDPRKKRVYYNRTGRKTRRPKYPAGAGAVSSQQYPNQWNEDARMMASYLEEFRR